MRRLFKLCTVLNLLWNPVGNQYILFKRMSLYSFQQLELKLIQVKISWHFQTCQSNGSLYEYYLHKTQRTSWDQSTFRNGAKITVIPLIFTKHQFRNSIEIIPSPIFETLLQDVTMTNIVVSLPVLWNSHTIIIKTVSI